MNRALTASCLVFRSYPVFNTAVNSTLTVELTVEWYWWYWHSNAWFWVLWYSVHWCWLLILKRVTQSTFILTTGTQMRGSEYFDTDYWYSVAWCWILWNWLMIFRHMILSILILTPDTRMPDTECFDTAHTCPDIAHSWRMMTSMQAAWWLKAILLTTMKWYWLLILRCVILSTLILNTPGRTWCTTGALWLQA